MRLEGFVDISPVLKAGVYALCAKGVVIYVGKAKNLYSRIYTHRSNWSRARSGKKIPSWMPVKGFLFDEVFIRPCRLEELDALEAEMINAYKPKYNTNLKLLGPPKVPARITAPSGRSLVLNAPPEIGRIERRL